MTEKPLPLIIVFDIDGTLIGDIRPQVMLYELSMSMKVPNRRPNIMNGKDFQQKLKNGIIRPYFTKFVKKLKETIPNVEFFIYTASERSWANFLVPHIEKACGCRFHRPILCRDNCLMFQNEYKKNVNAIYSCLSKTLKKQYGFLRFQDVENRILVIDNNMSVYDQNDQKRIIFCPTYDYLSPENIPTTIPRNIFLSHANTVYNVLGKYMPMPQSVDYHEFEKYFYAYYTKQLSSLYKHNIEQSKDKFFLYLLNIILYKRITSFSPSTIAYVSQKLAQKLNKAVLPYNKS
jgi:hypothetical protein